MSPRDLLQAMATEGGWPSVSAMLEAAGNTVVCVKCYGVGCEMIDHEPAECPFCQNRAEYLAARSAFADATKAYDVAFAAEAARLEAAELAEVEAAHEEALAVESSQLSLF